MTKFLKNSIIFFVVLVSMTYIADTLITTGLKKSKSYYFVDWNRIYGGKIDADIIINGNSKAYHHISPKIIDSVTRLNSYNLGLDG